MSGMNIAVFYLDPNKNSAKLTQATARDLNLIAADNFARAAAQQGINKILYVRGNRFDSETIQCLKTMVFLLKRLRPISSALILMLSYKRLSIMIYGQH